MRHHWLIPIPLIVAISCAQVPSYGNYGNTIANAPHHLLLPLAEHNRPNNQGAMGRNKPTYFHVRFQLGLHHLANYGLATKQSEGIEHFFNAAEYAFRFQLASGDFSLVVPTELQGLGTPSIANRASGVAFFASSLGSGIYALETSQWFQ